MPKRQNALGTKYQGDKIPRGQNTEGTKKTKGQKNQGTHCQRDKIPKGQNF